jgi:hypothetical protein
VAILAFALPLLARAVSRDPGEAVVLGALNPLVLLTLIAGAHNDALMVSLVLGVAMAAKKHPVWALAICALATAIKAPAGLSLVYIVWVWKGELRGWRDRVRPALLAAAVTGAVLGISTLLAGFGFGWVKNLATPGTVRSWAAPATGIGMGLAAILHAVGISVDTASILTVTRLLGFLTAVSLGAWLLCTCERRGWVRSLALSLLFFVILGPVVQPWYLVWGLLLLAPVYVGRDHFWLLLLSITSPFLGPAGRLANSSMD